MRQELAGGLVLRTGEAGDAEAMAAFNARIHAEPNDPGPDEAIAAWTRDLFTEHPTVTPQDFLVVEDPTSSVIVSSLCLISQTWSYDGVPFGVGRVELVGTDEAYRRRGLIRTQFDTIHEWSAERGELVQAITGIPWYYRQFGYEYALALDGGERALRSLLPDPAGGEDEAFRVRPATEADSGFIAETDTVGHLRSLVSPIRDKAFWAYEIDKQNEPLWTVQIIETKAGDPVGFMVHARVLQRAHLEVRACELQRGVSWLAVKTSLLRYLRAIGETYEAQSGKAFDRVTFLLEHDHPLYDATPNILTQPWPSYAWYIRVPDLPAFLRRIAPVLERRLAESVASDYSGELRLNFFRDGVRLSFEDGRLKEVTQWPLPERHEATVSFPDLTFLQCLFGYRSFDELYQFFPDCSARTEDGRVLMRALFPKKPSLVWGLA